MFAVKEHNAGKLDSHFWFCCAFADVLDPKYCFMVRDRQTDRQTFIVAVRSFDVKTSLVTCLIVYLSAAKQKNKKKVVVLLAAPRFDPIVDCSLATALSL
jgi:hypothetical protein